MESNFSHVADASFFTASKVFPASSVSRFSFAFSMLVKENDIVKKGQPLINVDLQAVQDAGYETTTMMIVTNGMEYKKIDIAPYKQVAADEIVMHLQRREA